MKNKSFQYGLIPLVVLLLLFASCRKEAYVHFGEQYKKIIYIVHAEGMEYKKEHSFEKLNDTIHVSVYCATTEPPAEDVKVSFKLDTEALDSINNLNALSNANYIPRQLLPSAYYSATELTAVIKKGAQYGVLSIPVNFSGIDPDVEYVLPLSIVTNDKGYDINAKLRTIGYQPVFINAYSGYYSGSSANEAETAPRIVSPVLKAMSRNTIRMPVHNLQDDTAFLATNYMLLTIGDDQKAVSIQPYGNAKVFDEGGSTYDAATQTFLLNYSFMNGATKVTVHEKIRDIEAINEEETP